MRQPNFEKNVIFLKDESFNYVIFIPLEFGFGSEWFKVIGRRFKAKIRRSKPQKLDKRGSNPLVSTPRNDIAIMGEDQKTSQAQKENTTRNFHENREQTDSHRHNITKKKIMFMLNQFPKVNPRILFLINTLKIGKKQVHTYV